MGLRVLHTRAQLAERHSPGRPVDVILKSASNRGPVYMSLIATLAWGCASPPPRYFPTVQDFFDTDGSDALVLLYQEVEGEPRGLTGTAACEETRYTFVSVSCSGGADTVYDTCGNDDGFTEIVDADVMLEPATGMVELCQSDLPVPAPTCALAQCMLAGELWTCATTFGRPCDEFVRGVNPFRVREW